MIGRKDRQMKLVIMDLESLVPKNHLLRKIFTNYLPKLGNTCRKWDDLLLRI
jgi:hypothetical protein